MTGSRRAAPVGARPRLGGLSALVAVVVLGILGMHALQSHAGMDPTTGLSGMTGMSGADTLSHEDSVGSTAPAPHEVAISSAPAAPSEPSGTGMLMLCGFMLLGLGLALLLARFARRIGAALHRLEPPRLVVPIRVWRLATGPPPVWDFSVIRC